MIRNQARLVHFDTTTYPPEFDMNPPTKATAENSTTDLNTLKDDLATLRSDLTELTESLIETGKDKAKKTYNSSVDSLTEFVNDKPMTALGAAFGVGALISILFCRR